MPMAISYEKITLDEPLPIKLHYFFLGKQQKASNTIGITALKLSYR